MREIEKITTVDRLFPSLYHIGMYKNLLPIELRGWVNILGLYVQLDLVGNRECLAAGGKYKRCFYAICEYTLSEKDSDIMASTLTDDFSHWKVKKFDQKVWEKRFAHLVEPTCEIVWYISAEREDMLHRYETSGIRGDFKEKSLPKLMDVVNHFNSTEEWLGLYSHQCASCGQRIAWWKYFCCEPCPHCGGKIRET